MDSTNYDKAAEFLTRLRGRRALFVGNNNLLSLQYYLSGLDSGLWISGHELPIRLATINRGWEWTSKGGFDQMEECGLTEEQRCLEAIDIYVDAFNLSRASQDAGKSPFSN
ncbi:MAG: hypothetical protein V4671_30930 [Armatimonadota bacterium]